MKITSFYIPYIQTTQKTQVLVTDTNQILNLPTSASDNVMERAMARSDGNIEPKSNCSETVSTVAVIICEKLTMFRQ